MNSDAFSKWLTQRQNAPVVPALQHPLQLGGTTAQKTLQPVQVATVNALAGKPYLPQPSAPTPYQGPLNHAIIATHQAMHKQAPDTTTPNITSAYLAPVPNLNLGS